jgi:hypothetical protein
MLMLDDINRRVPSGEFGQFEIGTRMPVPPRQVLRSSDE